MMGGMPLGRGEEFAIILSQTSASHAPEALLGKITEDGGEVASFPGVARSVTFSAGVASFPDHGTIAMIWLRTADTGLYAAKQADGIAFCVAGLARKAASPQ